MIRTSLLLCAILSGTMVANAQKAAEPAPEDMDVGFALTDLDPAAGPDAQLGAMLDAMGMGPEERMIMEAMLSDDVDPMVMMMLASMMGGGKMDEEALMIGMLMRSTRGPKVPQTVVMGDALLIVEDGWVYRIDPVTLEVTGKLRYREDNKAAAMLKALMPALDGAREKAQASACLSNMKQLCLAAMMYHEDTGTFPDTEITTTLMPYVKNDAMFSCPGGVDAMVGYAMNKDLAGMGMAQIAAPGETVLFFESVDPGARPLGGIEDAIACHDGMITVGFADGHCQLMTPDQLAELLKRNAPVQ